MVVTIRGSEYTRETRKWLNKRFSLFDSNGVYIPNQPAYGFCAAGYRLEEYSRMFAILNVLNRIPFRTVLDVGCADGYTPGLIDSLFGSRTMGMDLSDQAIRNARVMFRCTGVAAEAGSLPFPDHSFDLCICSEVLEHVVDPVRAVSEMRRVSRDFVVISTPRAPNRQARKRHFDQLDENEPHAHIHFFTDDEMRDLCGHDSLFSGARSRIINRFLDRIAWCDQFTLTQSKSYYRFMAETTGIDAGYLQKMYEHLAGRYEHGGSWKKRYVNSKRIAQLLRMDDAITRRFPTLALDHLVTIPVGGGRVSEKRKLPQSDLLTTMLGGFRIPYFRRSPA